MNDNEMYFSLSLPDLISQALNASSATLCVKLDPCTSGTYRSTWSRACLSATSATSSWRRPSSSWSTRSATPSPLEGSSKESKYSTCLPATSQNPQKPTPQPLPPSGRTHPRFKHSLSRSTGRGSGWIQNRRYSRKWAKFIEQCFRVNRSVEPHIAWNRQRTFLNVPKIYKYTMLLCQRLKLMTFQTIQQYTVKKYIKLIKSLDACHLNDFFQPLVYRFGSFTSMVINIYIFVLFIVFKVK